jgi:ATP-dependent DNA ligase
VSSVLSGLVDGEAVILGVDGVPDFNVLHSRKHDDEVQPYAFDILTLDGAAKNGQRERFYLYDCTVIDRSVQID